MNGNNERNNKYRGRYRIQSARLRSWDYHNNAAYFVTLCTKNRVCYFGDVVEDRVVLSETGIAAQQCWLEIPEHFPFVILDEFVIMPNHIHGIIIINNENAIGNVIVETQNFASLPSSASSAFPPFPTQSPYEYRNDPDQPAKNKFGPQSMNLGSIIRGFKIGVKNFTNDNGIGFAWQPRFHDSIIRNETALRRIRNYIKNNPANWNKDKLRH